MTPHFDMPRVMVEEIIRTALNEDLGRGGDLTTDAVIPADAVFRGRIVAREEGCLAGAGVAALAFELLDPLIVVERPLAEGTRFASGATLLRMAGPARAILTAERTALNFLGRLCGIASLTARFVAAVAATGAAVIDTRKTTPGLRLLEKYAVRCGGGSNHRFGLDDAVLIKDNHLAVAGSIATAVERVRARVGHTVKVEVEVDTREQLEEALAAGVDIVLLDNMEPDELRAAVATIGKRALTEASGGISLANAAAVADTGVDRLSIGALTHSAPSLDVGLDADHLG